MKHGILLAAAVVWLMPHVLAGQQTKPAPKLANPTTVVQQLMRMTPEERERALEKLPPQRQALIRERLEKFDRLPKAEQERRLRLGEIFANLPPDKQDLVRHQIQAFNQLPDDRRRLVGAAFQRLRRLPESQRRELLASERFRSRFSSAEQQMIADLSENLPPPGAEAPRP
ncbi:MAG TPA: DUF3106 domain-containing protein [Bryobacteraceae bacterium]|jgi:hypothetical protein